MSHLRWDPTLCEWVTYAPQRQDRTFLPPADWCPLCPTLEGGFPTEVPRSHYEIVVFENRFPSYQLEVPIPEEPGSPLTPTLPGYGVCEVVLYSDHHAASLASLEEERLAHLVDVWIDRYQALGARKQVQYVFIFENRGEAIGVTLQHPHGQIYGYPFIPPRPARELASARAFAAAHAGNCLHCAVLAQEQRDARRIVSQNDSFTAFVPFFAHYPYEMHVYAQRCAPTLATLNEAERRDLARTLKQVVLGYDHLWDRSLPYIMAIHQAPTDSEDYTGIAHLHLEFYPPNRTREKLKYLAGSEAGAGAFIMDALPEVTAGQLRDAVARSSGLERLPHP